jgi:hypothetical protein
VGWQRGHLSGAAALLSLLIASPTLADEPAAEPITPAEISEEDLEILEEFELLLELELLESWDPVEDLPIPVASERPKGEES